VTPRVLQVVLGLNPGGTERLVVELVKRLNDEVPMMVCCLDDAGAWAREVEAIGVSVMALNRGPGFQPSLGRGVADAMKRHGATIIHAHHYSPFVYSALARCRRPATRIVFTEHGRLSDAKPSGKRRAANTLLSRFPSQVFTVSEDLKRHLVAEGFPSKQVDVIYNGIDVGSLPAPAARVAVRRRLDLDDDAIVAGTIARLDPVKDLRTLIQAVAAANASGHQRSGTRLVLCIIGDGAEREGLEKATDELGARSLVRFLGHCDDAREWLAGCDIYVNSSISEGISLTILEGMAAGLPVVATRVGGTPEIVNESCARLVPARDPDALASALTELSAVPTLRQTLGAAGRMRVETRFTLDRMVGEYRSVYFGERGAGSGKRAGSRKRS